MILVTDDGVDYPSIYKAHDMFGIPEEAEQREPFARNLGVLPDVYLTDQHEPGLPRSTYENQALHNSRKIFNVEVRFFKIVNLASSKTTSVIQRLIAKPSLPLEPPRLSRRSFLHKIVPRKRLRNFSLHNFDAVDLFPKRSGGEEIRPLLL